jgi:hypothetical protein
MRFIPNFTGFYDFPPGLKHGGAGFGPLLWIQPAVLRRLTTGGLPPKHFATGPTKAGKK